jgi:hypothetical protein
MNCPQNAKQFKIDVSDLKVPMILSNRSRGNTQNVGTSINLDLLVIGGLKSGDGRCSHSKPQEMDGNMRMAEPKSVKCKLIEMKPVILDWFIVEIV